MVLLIGQDNDPCLHGVRNSLERDRADVVFVEEASLLSALGLAWRSASPVEESFLEVAGRRIALSSLTGVMARSWRAHTSDPQMTEKDRLYAGFEMQAALAGIFRQLPCTVINRPRLGMSFSPGFSDGRVMRAVGDAGFALPRMLVSTGREAGLRFYAESGNRAILGTPSNQIPRRFLAGSEGASVLERLPDGQALYLQAAGEGQWLQVYVVRGRAFACASPAALMENDGPPERLPAFDLDRDLSARCCQVAERIGLEFAQIHLLLNGAGPVFYDVNPYPRPWLCAEPTEIAITERLADVLRSGRTEYAPEPALAS